METPFADKVIFITGAASGIGRATSIKLSQLGATLFLTDIDVSGCDETASLCTNATRHATQRLDVGDSGACTAAVDAAASRLGAIHHVFNCAGVNPTPGPLDDTTDAYWDKLLNTNLRGVYAVTRAAIPWLRASAGAGAGAGQNSSSIVNVSSMCGLQPTAYAAIYCATKYGVIGFSKAMALELGGQGIRVNVVAPGFIDTPTNACVVAGEESVQRAGSKVALGRFGTADEVADVVAFLMGHESRYVNGSVVEINGGL